MTDERGGRYFREARFFLAGDKVVAQSHVPEARSLMGYMRDMQALGGPDIQVKYATLQDGTRIKAMMMNGQYQATILSSSGGKKKKIRPIRFIQVVQENVDSVPFPAGDQLGKPFNTTGYPHGALDGPHPQILFGTDVKGYQDFDVYKTEYALEGLDILSPPGIQDEFACGQGSAFWVDAHKSNKNGYVLTWGAPLGLGAPTASTQQGVYRGGRTIALPCAVGQTVIGAALVYREEIPTKLLVVTIEAGSVSTARRVRVKSAFFDPLDPEQPLRTTTDFSEVGTRELTISGYASGLPTWDATVGLYKFSPDASYAAGVIGGYGVSTIELDPCAFAEDKTYGYYSRVGPACDTVTSGTCDTTTRTIVGAEYTKDNVLQVLRHEVVQHLELTATTLITTEVTTETTACTIAALGEIVAVGSAVTTRNDTTTRTYRDQIINGVPTGSTCETSSELIVTRTWAVQTMPVAYSLEHRFFVSATVAADDRLSMAVTRTVAQNCYEEPGSAVVTTEAESNIAASLVSHRPAGTATVLSQAEGSSTVGMCAGILISPTNQGIVVDSKNFIVMANLGKGFAGLPDAAFAAPVLYSEEGAVDYSVGVLVDNGSKKRIPFVGTFFSSGLQTNGRFALVSAGVEIEIEDKS